MFTCIVIFSFSNRLKKAIVSITGAWYTVNILEFSPQISWKVAFSFTLYTPPDAGAEKEAEYDDLDPYKAQGDLKQQEAEARAREAMAQTGATIKELERTIGGSKRERSTHQTVDLGDLLES